MNVVLESRIFHRMNFIVPLVLFLCINLGIAIDSSQYVYVNSSRGQLYGFHADFGNDTSQLYYGQGDVFLGIPFAMPPVGERRFKRPERISTFSNDPYNATFYRSACIQDPLYINAPNVTVDEDCLYLNIFTPNAQSKTKYPVMIWIHGGQFTSGAAQEYPYKNAIRNLVSRDVVVVTIQYRLGFLGFFTTYTDDFPANNGMLDQVEAIKFIKEEIENFGGDPNKITLFGESAGSMSISFHTYSPLSQNLFQQGIFESGVLLLDGYSGYGNISFIYAYLLCNSTLEEWESNNFTELTNCLKPMNSSYFLSLEDVTNDWLVVVDGYFLPDFPANLWRQRPNIPIMIGHNRDETSFYDLQDFVYGQENFTSFTKDLVIAKITPLGEMGDGNSSEILEVIESVYFPPDTLENDHLTWLKVSEKILTSAAVTRFNAKFIDEYFRNGNENIFIYELAHAPKFRFKILEEISGWDPVPHGVDVEFLWMKGPWDSWISSDWILHDLALVELFGEAWTNFAKYSAPLGKNWKPANSTNWQYYQMGQYCGKMLQNYGQTDNIVWNQVLSALNAYTGTSYDLL